MAWTDQVFRYCERGQDPSFWAEPLNALSNSAFLVASLAALVLWARQDAGHRGLVELTLAAWVAVIGIGSFLFHTYATRWAVIADVVPIGVFVHAYLAYALRMFLRQGWLVTLVAVALFAMLWRQTEGLWCALELLPITAAAGMPCLNGSGMYLPALTALVGIGAIMLAMRNPGGPLVFTAGLVFLASLALRTFDFEWCRAMRTGTHFIWHTLNGAMLYLLLRAAILYGRGSVAAAAKVA